MSKKSNRFEKMELDPTDVPKKPTILEKLKFKRKLEIGGNEAQAERINNDLKKISEDIDKQAAENERRRSIQRQHDMVKTQIKVRKEQELDLQVRKQDALHRQSQAKQKVWLIGIGIFIVIGFIYFGGREGRNLLFEIVFALIAIFLGYGRHRSRRRGWWE